MGMFVCGKEMVNHRYLDIELNKIIKKNDEAKS